MGLTTCKKSNLRSQYDLDAHMRVGHPREWANINQQVSVAAAAKRINFEEAIVTKLLGDTPAPTAQPAVTPGFGTEVIPAMVQKPCDKCDFIAESTVAVAAANMLKAHGKKEHPDG